MRRYWINAPSTLQEEHKYHGMQILGPKHLVDDTVTVYPRSGPVISMMVSAKYLSQDWLEHDFGVY